MSANAVAEEAVRNVLLGVIDPELGDNIVDLGMVQRIEIDPRGGDVDVTIALTTAGCPLRAQIMKDIKLRVGSLPGVAEVRVHFGEMTTEQKKNVMARARFKARDNALDTDIPATTRIVAIASGKGGVGKSSVTANLAAQLAQRGLTVGVLDADIGGFSIPRMLGVEGRVQGEKDETGRARFAPLEKPIGLGLLKVMSMGSIEGTGEDQAIMWRGFMLNRAVQHFLEDVAWGDMHYLLIDMPPGTADIRMGLARMLGVEGRVQGVKDEAGRARFVPLEKPVGSGLLKVMSMGSIEGTGEDQAIMWRGFMLNRAVHTSSKTWPGATCTTC